MPKKKSSPAPAPSTTSDGVRVRMFCQGLGDCFLISIPQEGSGDYHVLIDCGVAMGTEAAVDKMKDVVQQIHDLTGGTIDVLVITHEHWDHVSGFIQAKDEMAKLKIKRLWMAWTEDPKDDLARKLKKEYGKAKVAAFQALAALASRQGEAGLDRTRKGMEGVMAFFGIDPTLGVKQQAAAAAAAAAGGGAASLDAAMDVARALVGNDSSATSFLIPGKTISLPGAAKDTTAATIKVRVLGPPHDEASVKKLNSTKETYDKQAHFGGVSWAWTGALAVDPGGKPTFEQDAAMPFERPYRIPLKDAEKDDFFEKHYYDKRHGSQPWEVEGFNLRRIDGDWLARGAQELALWINSYTNNVSLVLAFELPKSGNVLLFVGDAQVGNWLSWHSIKDFTDAQGKAIAMKDLFARTVLYKVGHHGSHNATLRAKGLEMMTHPDLVAMLPVDADRATKLGYGEMPLVSLQAAIKERADGRLLRLDAPWKGDQTPGTWPSNLVKARLVPRDKNIKNGVSYMEYTVRDK